METLGAAFSTPFQFARLKAFLNTIHSAIVVKLLGEGHGCGAVGFRTNGFNFMDEGIVVNGVAAVHVADREVKGVEKNHAEEFVVPDRVAEELAGAFGLEDAEDEDPVGSAADGIEGEGGELDEFVEEIGQIPAHRIVRPGEAEKRSQARINVPDAAVLGDDDRDDLRIGRANVP